MEGVGAILDELYSGDRRFGPNVVASGQVLGRDCSIRCGSGVVFVGLRQPSCSQPNHRCKDFGLRDGTRKSVGDIPIERLRCLQVVTRNPSTSDSMSVRAMGPNVRNEAHAAARRLGRVEQHANERQVAKVPCRCVSPRRRG